VADLQPRVPTVECATTYLRQQVMAITAHAQSVSMATAVSWVSSRALLRSPLVFAYEQLRLP